MDWALASKNFNKCKVLLGQHGRFFRSFLITILFAAMTSACASRQSDDGFQTVYDPLEPLNRSIFQVNEAVDFIVIRPISATYRQVVPDPLQEMVTNFLRNLATPVTLLNELLQGDLEGAEVAVTRFFLNSTVGLAGLIDIAGYNTPELAHRSEDFGQTLGVWGVGDGPYLVLPLLGPTNLRDGVGRIVDTASDPLTYYDDETFAWTRLGLTAVDARARSLDALDEVKRSSIDYYAAIRSLYWQNRRSEIFDGAPPQTDSFPDFDDFDDEEFDDSGVAPVAPAGETTVQLSEARPPAHEDFAEMLILDLEPLRE